MQMIADAIGRCRQVLEDLVNTSGELDRSTFRASVEAIKDAVNDLGREALKAVVAQAECSADVIVHEGEAYRFKQTVAKKWLTPFGLMDVARRFYQRDSGGRGFAPIDVACGMVGRFMTADVEELSAFAAALGTPAEAADLLAKALRDGPSPKAISRAVKDVGSFLEDNAEDVERQIVAAAPLSEDGDVLAVSWDGVMVATREDSGPKAWKEAGVSTISVYRSPSDDSPDPERVDARCFARMPELGMRTLMARIQTEVETLCEHRTFRRLVVLCDGKDFIWRTAESLDALKPAIFILDFYHASSYIADVAKAIYGDGTPEAERWHRQWRDKLQLDEHAVGKLIRAITRACAGVRRGSDRHEVLRRAVKFLRQNRERMRYAMFIAEGLPIGSGPVEAACKTVVGNRLKRSGMRWSITGGQHILNLRCPVKSGRWEQAWAAYLDRAA